MDEPPTGYETVFKTRHRRKCFELRLVLDAAGIFADAQRAGGWWYLIVSSDDQARAAAEVEAYLQENPAQTAQRSTASELYGGAAAGVCVYAGIILWIALATSHSVFGLHWLEAGRMQAGQVIAGEGWRTVTALTLHLDAGHLAGNLAFGAVFGFLAGRILGGGVAWLGIVIAGLLGNLVNAMVQPPTHTSIGASTAVFAALGMLVAHALRPPASPDEKPLRRWRPLIGGVLLLAFTGIGGERTDVAAHVTGFLAGLLIGWLGCGLPSHWLANGTIQKLAAVATVAILAGAWVVALLVDG